MCNYVSEVYYRSSIFPAHFLKFWSLLSLLKTVLMSNIKGLVVLEIIMSFLIFGLAISLNTKQFIIIHFHTVSTYNMNPHSFWDIVHKNASSNGISCTVHLMIKWTLVQIQFLAIYILISTQFLLLPLLTLFLRFFSHTILCQATIPLVLMMLSWVYLHWKS